MTIVERLKLILKAKGMKQRELANAVDMKPSTVSKILTGRRTMNIYDFYIFSRTFGCSIEDLCGMNPLLDELLKKYGNEE